MNLAQVTFINLLVLVANIGIFGLTLKLYTEILKDQSQNRRARQSTPQGGKHD